MLTRALRTAFVAAALCAMSIASVAAASDRKHPDDLPAVRDLPDLFTAADGTKVAGKEQWPKRRAQLQQLVLNYEYGHLPPATPVRAAEQTWKVPTSAEKGEAKRAENPIPLPTGASETQL